MAYSGFISSPEYTRKTQNEEITGDWTFNGETKFTKTIRGVCIATYYGDLAEYYQADISEVIPCGSLVKFGGDKEITKCFKNDTNFFGVISTEPGVELNKPKSNEGDYLPVALCGRVPCRVSGKIKKFDKLTTSDFPGVAKKKTLLDTLLLKPTIGIALEDKQDNLEKLVHIFVKSKL